MPRLCEFYGIVISMYFQDHAPPHVHAIYAEHEALVRIEDGAVIRGALPRTAAALVQRWCLLRNDELQANWTRAQTPSALEAVEPLQ